jgi:NAD(P)-dependent dehydrogenase (short-subunit alcohol dehydrogenase family)
MSEQQSEYPQGLPPQHQENHPGTEAEMEPRPHFKGSEYRASGKLEDKVAIITGGDSGIGRAVAITYAKEGADVAILYLSNDQDAAETRKHVEAEGRKCLLIKGDVRDEEFCFEAVRQTIQRLGKLNILVNNAAVQYITENIEDLTAEQLDDTFRTNIFSYFYMVKAAIPHLHEGDAIINTTSVTAYKGNPKLLDYSATKGAIVAFTRSLSQSLVKRGIRVNGVAPGPIWTPLIPSSFDAEHVGKFGQNKPMGRPGQPEEVAPSYVFLASQDASYFAGQILHPNGGEVVNG